ncbi:MAG: hypothetical protein EA388_06475 [Nitriliruptor sp.]|nr:MAG: hypothetical protein EA388_06475 [Nitriliruptor sp.]
MPRTGAPTRQRSASIAAVNGPAERRTALESAFLAWLDSPVRPDESGVDGPAQQTVPIGRVLGELSLSPTPLPDGAAAQLGLPVGTSIGHAAAELVVAVNDPAIERCRSYRSAVDYLAELDRPVPPRDADGQGG